MASDLVGTLTPRQGTQNQTRFLLQQEKLQFLTGFATRQSITVDACKTMRIIRSAL